MSSQSSGSEPSAQGASRRKAVEQISERSQMYRDTKLGEPVVLRQLPDDWGLTGDRDYLQRRWYVQRPRCFIADHGCEVETITQATKVQRMEGRYENVTDDEVDEIIDEAVEQNTEWMKAHNPHIPSGEEGGANVHVDGEYLPHKYVESETAVKVQDDAFDPDTVVRVGYAPGAGITSVGVDMDDKTIPVEEVAPEDALVAYEAQPDDYDFRVELRHKSAEDVEDCQ